jgi:hypothetical protein
MASTQTEHLRWTSTDFRIFVKVENDVGARYATIGGAVEITSDDGSVKRWNLTVSHVFDENISDNGHLASSHPPHKAVTEYDSVQIIGDNAHRCSDNAGPVRDDGMDSETQFVLEKDSTTARSRSGICSPSVEWLSDLSLSGFQRSTQALAVTAGHGVPLSHRNHDWAIIDAPHVSPCPFRLPSEKPHAASQQTSQVMFHTGSGGTRTGILSKRPTFVMSGVDGSVVENYTLRLRDRSGTFSQLLFGGRISLTNEAVTRPGDCGSWVVDVEDAVVYGYVIAPDALGDAYVMPMDAVLRDIQSALGARHVKLYELPELSPFPSLLDMQAHTATQKHATVTVMQPASSCGSLDGVIYQQERSLDSGYGTAHATPEYSLTAHDQGLPIPQVPVQLARPVNELRYSSVTMSTLPYQDADAGSLTSAGSYTSDHYGVFDRPSMRRSPPYLPDNEVPSNFTSPYKDSRSPSGVIDERKQQQEATRSFNIPKDEGQSWCPQPSRWQTTRNAVSRFKRIFRSGNSESKSEKKPTANGRR